MMQAQQVIINAVEKSPLWLTVVLSLIPVVTAYWLGNRKSNKMMAELKRLKSNESSRKHYNKKKAKKI